MKWNQFRIVMVDNKVTVWLNEKLVVDHAVLENDFDKDRKLPPTEAGADSIANARW